jgi:hypothetical protein
LLKFERDKTSSIISAFYNQTIDERQPNKNLQSFLQFNKFAEI